MNRRGFLGSILAASVAPAIVRADSLMRVLPTETFVMVRGALTSAAWVGAIRELRAHDILQDRMLYRYDLAVDGAAGELEQLTLTLENGDAAKNRALAMELMRVRARSGALTPRKGILQIPVGFSGEGAFL